MKITITQDSYKIVRGILAERAVIHGIVAGKDTVVVIPTGTQVEVRTNPDWYGEVTQKDIENASKGL